MAQKSVEIDSSTGGFVKVPEPATLPPVALPLLLALAARRAAKHRRPTSPDRR